MTWRFPPEAPEAVHIYGVRQSDGEMMLDPRFHISRYLRDCANGMPFEYTGVANIDVRSVTFCAFLAEFISNPPNVRALQAMGGCFVSLTIGHADVLFDVKSKPCGNELASHRITIKSSASFEPGILGYSYDFNGRGITVEFPGRIDYGKKEYPAIYLLKSAPPPTVCVTSGSGADVTIERKRLSFFRC